MLRRSLIFLVFVGAERDVLVLATVRLNPQSATLREHKARKAISHDWQQVIHDPRLQQVVTIALNSNRDVQKAIADIDSARALWANQCVVIPDGECGLKFDPQSFAGEWYGNHCRG